MKNPIWTLEEIINLPEFGGKNGWFYGLVKNHETGLVWIYEIFPGMGYATALDRHTFWNLKTWRWIVSDIWQAIK